ncbi:MlaE family ABC transporter permease [Fulvimonas soli]|uniref:Phospholipid/cholesterol/gamma-HCH transport system permease protein n=1 Tax=Fulvimonas soli TaxID=155197 RepID=A0A316I5C0_9GAMM|nr:ABC transporter permease [Fulvimonas soli]PWK88476.1 phospholipid/cholesterol/gamma-HCH transport system permease protein [Fulvimonas soli]TNY26874.1 ABC transporter permease [Fulvimonas soli]
MGADSIEGTARLDTATTPARLLVAGDWTLAHYPALQRTVAALGAPLAVEAAVDFSALGRLDTAGATLLAGLLGARRLDALAAADGSLPAARRALLRLVDQALESWETAAPRPRRVPAVLALLERIGRTMAALWRQQLLLLGFIGLTLQTLARVLPRPRRWRPTPLAAHVEQTGMDAIPIVALLTFMVGAVVAFLGATVLKDFGASIYTVDLVAFSFLREFGVLLTAILMAGRTASAFTAQIGSMKANEEIDAIRALGLDPMELLVLPRVLALLVSLPMLTFLAMLSGIAGGMLVCALALDVPPAMFLDMFKQDVGVRHFLLGLCKAPVFAFLIAVIGCLEGFKVGGSAQSVGEHTTSSVVQSIFVVILIDALAALFFMEMDW